MLDFLSTKETPHHILAWLPGPFRFDMVCHLRTHLQSIQSHPISGLFPLAPIEHEQKVRTHMKPQLLTTCLPALNWIFESSSNGSWKAPRKQIIMFHFTAVGTRRGAPCRRRWCSSEATIPALFQVIHSQAFSTIKHSQVVSQLGPHCKSSSIPKPSQGKACQSLSFPS